MRLRLRTLEAAVSEVEGAVAADSLLAVTLRRIWRYEASQALTKDQEYERMMLAREVHAGHPEAFQAVAELLHEEAEYMDHRAREFVVTRVPKERALWSRLLRGDVID